jgi:hypothetical protein
LTIFMNYHFRFFNNISFLLSFKNGFGIFFNNFIYKFYFTWAIQVLPLQHVHQDQTAKPVLSVPPTLNVQLETVAHKLLVVIIYYHAIKYFILTTKITWAAFLNHGESALPTLDPLTILFTKMAHIQMQQRT